MKLRRRAGGRDSSKRSEAEGSPQEVSPLETTAILARRRGYVVHGEFGLKIAFDDDVVSDGVLSSIARGAYERWEARRAIDLVEDDDRVVELGAGLGFLSCLLLRNKRIADYQLVEADPRLIELIRRTHRLNNVKRKATFHSCIATCDPSLTEKGAADFSVAKDFSSSSVLGAIWLKHEVSVPVISLPALIAASGSTVLIADIEGAEVDIFNGTELPTIKKILAEIHPDRIGPDGVRSVFRNLDRIGFVFDPKISRGMICVFRRYDEPAADRGPAAPSES